MSGIVGYAGKRNALPVTGAADVAPPSAVREREENDRYVLRGIYEQPQLVMDTLGEWIDAPSRLSDQLGITGKIKHFRRLHIIGRGTSYHAGLVARHIIERFVHMPVTVDIASEYRYLDSVLTKGTLFITLTHSGETADAIAAQREARDKGAHTISICNVDGSSCAREADSVLYTRVGPEPGPASTKTYMAQLAMLCILGIALGTGKGKLTATELDTLKSVFRDLPCLISKTLRTDGRIRNIAETLSSAERLLYLGRGVNYPVALEGALKMREISHIRAEGFPTSGMQDDSLAFIEDGIPVVILAPLEGLYEMVLPNIKEARTSGGRIVAVTDAPMALKDLADDVIVMPPTHPALLPFVNIVPLQLLAYHAAFMRRQRNEWPHSVAVSAAIQ